MRSDEVKRPLHHCKMLHVLMPQDTRISCISSSNDPLRKRMVEQHMPFGFKCLTGFHQSCLSGSEHPFLPQKSMQDQDPLHTKRALAKVQHVDNTT